MTPLRVLVGIANFGTRNRVHLDRLLAAWRAMPYEVEVHVFSERPKDYPADVTVHVGLPTRDPWSLPFAHRALFAGRVDRHDLFVYSEDDTLIEQRHLEAFLAASRALPDDHVAGFLRYEQGPDGARSYPDIHGPYHWAADSVGRAGGYLHARLSNEHAACYVLTQAQLRRAVASGGYAVAPHAGRYDLLCSAGTDPYTQCGLTRVICISHLADFEVHHLPDAYVNGRGMIAQDCAVTDGAALRPQLQALADIATGRASTARLFATEKRLPTPRWDKRYHEAPDAALLARLPPAAVDVLSVGCGSGAMEACLATPPRRVVAIPLDAVIARAAERHGVTVTSPDFGEALGGLARSRFDAIVLRDVLQHVEDPAALAQVLALLLRPGGRIVGSVPNLGRARRWAAQVGARHPGAFRVAGGWRRTGLHASSAGWLRGVLARAGLRLERLDPEGGARLLAPTLRFVAARSA